MRILLLAAGNDIHAVRWANKLSENGNEVHLCYVANHKPSMDKFNKEVILHKLTFPAPYGYYMNVLQLKSIIHTIKPDILNAHYATGYGILGRLANFSPYLISVYGTDVYDFPFRNKLNMKLIKKNLTSADGIASTSYTMAGHTSKLIDIPTSDIFITPFGVDIEKFSKQLIKKNNDSIIIGTIKKLEPNYGIRYGILAINYLVKNLMKDEKSDFGIKYYIYGEGKEQEELEKLVKECNLQEIVEFKGRIPNKDVPKALNELDVFLATSNNESFGVAVVEAMACEVPVVVTDADGFKEVVDYGETGLIVPKKNYKEMAKAIFKLIKDPEFRRKLGKKQRKRVIKNYNWNENVNKMQQIYNLLVRKNNK